MGVLEELEQQAASVKEQQAQEEAANRAQANRKVRALLPRMQAAYDYFRKLKGNLEVVTPDVSAVYEVDGVGELTGLVQGGYRLYTDDRPDQVKAFGFMYAYSNGKSVEVALKHRVAAQSFKDYLARNNLKFVVRDNGNSGVIFTVQAWISAGFEFGVDREAAKIAMKIRNIGMLGVSVHRFDADRINREFLDEVAKCVLHKTNRLPELTGNHLTETKRFRLKAGIEEERRARDQELDKVAAPGPALKASLGKRFSRTFLGRG